MAGLLRKAIEWQALLKSGEATNQAAIARQEGITRARVTQILMLLRLAPEIQEHILKLPKSAGRSGITERRLRPVCQFTESHAQCSAFADLIALTEETVEP